MTTATWQLLLFGGIELRGPQTEAAERVLVQPKHVALLAYLSVEDARGSGERSFHRRDHLATLLWPELDQSHARGSLRRVVHQIRETLGEETLVSRGDEQLSLGADQLESDVGSFSRLVREGKLEEALELQRRELMQGFHVSGCAEYARWLDDRRNELRQDAAAAAWALAQRFEQNEEKSMAGRWARHAVQFSWDDERVIRRAITMLDRVGDRVGALRLYDDFARRLRAEFDSGPSPETVTLVEKIRS